MTRVTIEAASVDAALQLYFAFNEICKNSDVRNAPEGSPVSQIDMVRSV